MREKPHILHVVAWWPQKESPFRGLFIREHILATRNNFNPTVLHLEIDKSNEAIPFKISTTEQDDEGLRVIRLRISTSIRRFGVHDWLVKRAYSQAISRIEREQPFDLYHIHVRTHLTKLVPELSILRSKPFLLSEHFSFYHRGFFLLEPQEQKTQQAAIARWFQSTQLRRIMPVSSELMEVLASKFEAPEGKLKMVRNIASSVFAFDSEIGRKSGKLVLVASWNKPKNPRVFIEALQLLPKALAQGLEVHFIGDGPELTAAKELIDSSVREISFEFHGPQSKTYIARHLKEAQFLVHPTDAENAPTVISEALCCGTPVLSMAVNGIPEMVTDQNGHLVPPGDAAALAKAMEQMLNHSSFDHRTIAEEARMLYSPEAVGASIEAEYHQIIDQHG